AGHGHDDRIGEGQLLPAGDRFPRGPIQLPGPLLGDDQEHDNDPYTTKTRSPRRTSPLERPSCSSCLRGFLLLMESLGLLPLAVGRALWRLRPAIQRSSRSSCSSPAHTGGRWSGGAATQ